jgi:hypothetical protein
VTSNCSPPHGSEPINGHVMILCIPAWFIVVGILTESFQMGGESNIGAALSVTVMWERV